MNRINKHIILPVGKKEKINFYFDGRKLSAFKGEILSSALAANGIDIFSYHHKDGSAQGIYCANGQCTQCSVIVDGVPVKSCITFARKNMKVETLKNLPVMKDISEPPIFDRVETKKTDVLIIGAGPAGLSAAKELGDHNIDTLVIDDKHKPGGKLVLQTHKFFGSVEDCYAGTRGIEIADLMSDEIKKLPSVKIWLETVAVGVFSDNKVGVIKDNTYYLISPKALLVAAGAREKALIFKGSTLPGVYGAGAFQTLVNRDMVKPCKKLFIVGGGNVGLIAGYHALQAGIKVAGVIEAMSRPGGYKVHADKLKRLDVPVYTNHTILSANGKNKVESVTIAQIDKNFKPVKNTQKTFAVDTVLIAVGLNPCDELYRQAKKFGVNVYNTGDSDEISEASAAIFSGKIAGRKITKKLNSAKIKIPSDWHKKLEILKSRPGKTKNPKKAKTQSKIFPIFHCKQEIPCNPCVSVCPKKSIKLETKNIMSLPYFEGACTGCFKCVTICPGLAVTLADYREDEQNPTLWLAYEIDKDTIKKGTDVVLNDSGGNLLFKTKVAQVKEFKQSKTLVAGVKVSAKTAQTAAGIKPLGFKEENPCGDKVMDLNDDDLIVCRCERVTLGEIKKAIRHGVRDVNQLKALTRTGMGACGGKSCLSLLFSIFKSEGVDLKEVTSNTYRPLVMEVPLGQFCNIKEKK